VAVIVFSIGLYTRRGAFAAVATFLITFIAALAAVNYYPLIERLILMIHRDTAAYADGIALLLTYLLVFLVLQYLAIVFLEENINLNPIVNGLAGAIFGGLSGVLFSGLLVIAWFMLPGSIYYRPDQEDGPKVAAGVDEKLLSVVRFMANDRIGGEAPFDPAHDFMRTATNKFAEKPSESAETPRGPAAREPGRGGEVDEGGRPGDAGRESPPKGGRPGLAETGGLRPRDQIPE